MGSRAENANKAERRQQQHVERINGPAASTA
jgi:hypothetical protein